MNYLYTGSSFCLRCCRCCPFFSVSLCLSLIFGCNVYCFFFNMSLTLNEIPQSALCVVQLRQVYDEDGPIHRSNRGAWTARCWHSTNNTIWFNHNLSIGISYRIYKNYCLFLNSRLRGMWWVTIITIKWLVAIITHSEIHGVFRSARTHGNKPMFPSGFLFRWLIIRGY